MWFFLCAFLLARYSGEIDGYHLRSKRRGQEQKGKVILGDSIIVLFSFQDIVRLLENLPPICLCSIPCFKSKELVTWEQLWLFDYEQVKASLHVRCTFISSKEIASWKPSLSPGSRPISGAICILPFGRAELHVICLKSLKFTPAVAKM